MTTVPPHMIEANNEVVRTSRRMFVELGREPTPGELATELAMPREKIPQVAGRGYIPVERAARVRHASAALCRQPPHLAAST